MMIVAGWWLHCVAIATVLCAGALAWELAARSTGRPARWSWFAALAGSVTLPWLLRLLPERVLPDAVASMPVLTLDAVTLQAPVQATTVTAGDVALLMWLASSLLMLGVLGVMLARLARARRGWRLQELEGGPVFVSEGIGPAALGVKGSVVLPAWALELDAELRRLLLLHERAHVQAGDPRLLLASLGLLSLMPWNPVLWVQVLRLRNAIELDCDARVLRTGASPRAYGSLLLEVGRRRSTNAFVMATFAEPRLFLEERIRRIAQWPQPRRPLRAVALALLALLLFGTAASARDPLRIPTPAELQGGDEVPAMIAAIDTPPVFTPMTKKPELVNPGEVVEALRAAYPGALRDAGVSGTTHVWLFVDEQGAVKRTQLERSSGFPAIDEAALNVASQMKFSPAENRGERVAVWIQLPIRLQAPGTSTLEEIPVVGRRMMTALPPDTPPVVQQRTLRVRPELLNVADVQRAMVRAYPPILRDAGIGGVVKMWFYIDADGRVVRTQLGTSSGYPALDEAAARIAEVMRFSPPVDGAQKVAAWVELPIVFGNHRVEQSRLHEDITPLDPVRVVGERMRSGDAPPPPPAPPMVRLREQPETATRVIVGADTTIRLRRSDVSLQRLGEEPVFTPMTKRPELTNVAAVQQALVRNYPPALRDAGIGGTTVVWFLIDENGAVRTTKVSKTAGYPALDEAALRIAEVMTFTPAENRDEKVPVWVEIPIMFRAK